MFENIKITHTHNHIHTDIHTLTYTHSSVFKPNLYHTKFLQHFSLYVINEPNKLVLQYTRLERLATDIHSSLLGPFISC
jgi:hypothetical protein